MARQPDHPVNPIFVNRWSPRAFDAKPVPRAVLHSMAEAARWAPSSANLQPWRFVLLDQGSPLRSAGNATLESGNRDWMVQAPVLAFVVARKVMGPNPWAPPETPNAYARFDTGMATIQFILEGERHDVRSHVVAGFDAQAAHRVLGLDDAHEVVAAIAVGYAAAPSILPGRLQQRETPSGRKPASEVVSFA